MAQLLPRKAAYGPHRKVKRNIGIWFARVVFTVHSFILSCSSPAALVATAEQRTPAAARARARRRRLACAVAHGLRGCDLTGERPSAERKRKRSAWDRGAARGRGLLVGIMLCSCRAHTYSGIEYWFESTKLQNKSYHCLLNC